MSCLSFSRDCSAGRPATRRRRWLKPRDPRDTPMLFDLKGKRRRTVQATYLMLAVLMGAGLVLFGIGSSVNGGLGDLFKGGNGSNKADETIQKRIDAPPKRLQRDPRNQAAL